MPPPENGPRVFGAEHAAHLFEGAPPAPRAFTAPPASLSPAPQLAAPPEAPTAAPPEAPTAAPPEAPTAALPPPPLEVPGTPAAASAAAALRAPVAAEGAPTLSRRFLKSFAEAVHPRSWPHQLGVQLYREPVPTEELTPWSSRSRLTFRQPTPAGEEPNFFRDVVKPRAGLLGATGFQLFQYGLMQRGDAERWLQEQATYCDMVASLTALTQRCQTISLRALAADGQAKQLIQEIDSLRLQTQAWQQQLARQRTRFTSNAARTILLNIILCLMLAFYLFGKKERAAAALARGDAAVAELLKADPLLAQAAAATVQGGLGAA